MRVLELGSFPRTAAVDRPFRVYRLSKGQAASLRRRAPRVAFARRREYSYEQRPSLLLLDHSLSVDSLLRLLFYPMR